MSHKENEAKELDNFLLREVDLLTAMGTSALEGAKLSIPTLMIDLSYHPVKKGYKYRFLYETINYDLGHFITSADYGDKDDTLRTRLLEVINNYTSCAEKSYNYFMNNHDLSKISSLFLKKVEATTLTFGMIDPAFFRKSIPLRLYNKVRGLSA